jgi:hypothetical protein
MRTCWNIQVMVSRRLKELKENLQEEQELRNLRPRQLLMLQLLKIST